MVNLLGFVFPAFPCQAPTPNTGRITNQPTPDQHTEVRTAVHALKELLNNRLTRDRAAEQIARAGGIKVLVSVAKISSDGGQGGRALAAEALGDLAIACGCCYADKVVSYGALKALVSVMSTTSEDPDDDGTDAQQAQAMARSSAVLALANAIRGSPRRCRAAVAAGAVPILCSLLGEQLEAIKRYENGPDPGFCSAAALTDIVEIGDNACRRKVSSLGAIELLTALDKLVGAGSAKCCWGDQSQVRPHIVGAVAVLSSLGMGTEIIVVNFGAEEDSPQLERTKYCDWCGELPSDHAKLKRCAACSSVSYCSRECQRKDWREGGHKRDCEVLKRALPPSIR